MKIKLFSGVTYRIQDYAMPNCFVILLGDMTAADVVGTLTEANLSEIRFMTDSGAVTGVYRNKMLCGYTDKGDALEVRIDDADLCRYGLTLDENNRIVSATAQRYAPDHAVIVDELPKGNLHDYLYIDSEFIYDPLPIPDEPDPLPTQEERITQLEEELAAAKILLGLEA